jgi:hypothetical protein
VFRFRPKVVVYTIAVCVLVASAVLRLHEALTPPEHRWGRVWDGEKLVVIHPGAWANHPLNPDAPKR